MGAVGITGYEIGGVTVTMCSFDPDPSRKLLIAQSSAPWDVVLSSTATAIVFDIFSGAGMLV